eukprot:3007135-Rhodomonas_salina.2
MGRQGLGKAPRASCVRCALRHRIRESGFFALDSAVYASAEVQRQTTNKPAPNGFRLHWHPEIKCKKMHSCYKVY